MAHARGRGSQALHGRLALEIARAHEPERRRHGGRERHARLFELALVERQRVVVTGRATRRPTFARIGAGGFGSKPDFAGGAGRAHEPALSSIELVAKSAFVLRARRRIAVPFAIRRRPRARDFRARPLGRRQFQKDRLLHQPSGTSELQQRVRHALVVAASHEQAPREEHRSAEPPAPDTKHQEQKYGAAPPHEQPRCGYSRRRG